MLLPYKKRAPNKKTLTRMLQILSSLLHFYAIALQQYNVSNEKIK
ncbi:hypothetical protein SAMN05192574_10735 [Mucilaginibacter gossypiicola]|uniref:Uncharacterized protein n=1 Tax=Mucilaginibacter gossypiicola TaxID=551995 RepID=A0A1H8NP93_9SPHI|nr:hypothetical protein SAMN05192574_10735 [Mucilaginibacter gossypiicola]